MNNTNPFSNLKFDLRQRPVSPRILAVGLAFVAFTVFWLVIPRNDLYWILLSLILGLTWAASFGWRQAVVALIEFLRSLLEI